MPSARERSTVAQMAARSIVRVEKEYVDDTVQSWLPGHVYVLEGTVKAIKDADQTMTVDFGGGDQATVDWGTDQLPRELALGSAIRVLYDPGESGTASSLWFDGLRH